MYLIYRALLGLIEFTILVGLAGGLVDLTRSMGREAIKAHKTGIVSTTICYLSILFTFNSAFAIAI